MKLPLAIIRDLKEETERLMRMIKAGHDNPVIVGKFKDARARWLNSWERLTGK